MKLKHLLFSVLCALSLTLVGTSLFAQNFQWVEQANSQNYIITNDVAHDAAGNSYVVGRYNYGTTVEVGQLSITGSGYLLIKYDPIGNVLWARTTQASSGNRTVPNSVAVDKSGNVFVTGYFVNNTTFVAPNRSISLNRISTLPSGNPETFLVKYDQNGDLNWATAAGGTPVVTFDGANGVAVDTMGNAYIT